MHSDDPYFFNSTSQQIHQTLLLGKIRVDDKRYALIAWEKGCMPKDQGGLIVIDLDRKSVV